MTPAKVVPHPTRAERVARGKAARAAVGLAAHATFDPSATRADPVSLLEQQASTRVPELVPIRYGRMLVSPFAFYRGAALVMAADLAGAPDTGLRTQLCGDAHMSNFGVFGTPERNLVFDVNDFDETLPGPFEWDVKRLAASLEIAGRDNGFKEKRRRAVVLSAATGYRTAMLDFAGQSNIAVWYAHLDMDRGLAEVRSLIATAGAQRTEAELAKARTKDSLQAFDKLATVVDGVPQIVSDPPLVVRLSDLIAGDDVESEFSAVRDLLRTYRRTLSSDRKHLLDQYRLADVARKVVGVGSVGMRAWILLLEGVDGNDPMFLQAKEAQPSVLAAFAGPSSYANHGQRVVAGQHLMQEVSDIFLGWQRISDIDGVQRDYYVRQLRDWKRSAAPEGMRPTDMAVYARLCGWTLARAHARSGDRVAIAAYLGNKDTFDNAIADFAASYADQNERDYAALRSAAKSGRIQVQRGL
ncbi:MAG TPA: DUF2252 domain-containing protein [Jatrophihabitantaceae bacterium]